jgi:acetyl esterase/lipase
VIRAEHAYGDHPSQRCELLVPDGPGPFPVAAVFHGGCFRQHYDSSLMLELCDDLNRRGWAAWNVEYRRLGVRGEGGGWPHTFHDAAAAIDALAELDAGLDLGRVAAIGHSAGGCLALWAGGRADGAVLVEAAVGQAPLADLAACAREGVCGEQVQTLLEGGPDERPDRYRDASPAERLPLRCRTLVVHGALDDTVPQAHSVAFARAAGAGCAVVLPDDGDHMEHLDPRSASWRAVVEWL